MSTTSQFKFKKYIYQIFKEKMNNKKKKSK